MMKKWLLSFVALAPALALFGAPPPVVTALLGNDPVVMTEGREEAGKPEITAEWGLYRYRFVSAENKAKFVADPERYAIQYGGACANMGPLSGLGDPNRYTLYEGRIYSFASGECKKAFLDNPSAFIDSDDAPPQGSPADEEKARGLLDRAVDGFGGADAVATVKSLQTKIKLVQQRGSREVVGWREVAIGFPDRYRFSETWGAFQGGHAMSGGEGFRFSGAEAWPVKSAELAAMRRDLYRSPLALLKARGEAGFKAVAAGAGRVGETAVEWVDVGLPGVTTRLAIDPQSGRVLQVSYRGWTPKGLGQVTRTFSEYRKSNGLTLPHGIEIRYDGEPAGSALAVESVTTNGPLDPGLFRLPGEGG
jgi:YHS domain-containing protein